MAEYIERQKAIGLFYPVDSENDGSDGTTIICKSGNYSSEDIESMLSDVPAEDVAPVRHGRWDGDTCTSCNLPWNYNMTQNAQDWGYFDPMPDYCPNCGAKMDLEATHE